MDPIIEQNPKIVVKPETKGELDKIGAKNETYDEIIVRLIKFFKERNK